MVPNPTARYLLCLWYLCLLLLTKADEGQDGAGASGFKVSLCLYPPVEFFVRRRLLFFGLHKNNISMLWGATIVNIHTFLKIGVCTVLFDIILIPDYVKTGVFGVYVLFCVPAHICVPFCLFSTTCISVTIKY